MPTIDVLGCDWCCCQMAPEDIGNYILDGRVYALCPSCAEPFVCPNCQTFIGRNTTVFSYTLDRRACENCDPDDFCENCGGRVVAGYLYEDWHGDKRCKSCLSTFHSHVRDYGFKPDPVFYGDYEREDEVHLGLELEFYAPEQGNRHQAFLAELSKWRHCLHGLRYNKEKGTMSVNDGRWYFKHDGSLSHGSYGAELVTHPHTLYEMKDHVAPFIDDVLRTHCDVDYTCGIHIHIDKAQLSYLDRAKLHTFLLCNKENAVKVAGRESDDFAPFRRRDNDKVGLKNALNGYEERHTFLNHRPKNTVEMRVFSSSTKPEVVLAYLQFAHSLVFFCKKHTLRECTDNTSWVRFVQFVSQRPQYAELLNMLQEKQLDSVGYDQIGCLSWTEKFKFQTCKTDGPRGWLDSDDEDYLVCCYCNDSGAYCEHCSEEAPIPF